jgi:hypothetical protein
MASPSLLYGELSRFSIDNSELTLKISYLVDPKPGQLEVDAGVIVIGYPGNPVLDNRNLPIRIPASILDQGRFHDGIPEARARYQRF